MDFVTGRGHGYLRAVGLFLNKCQWPRPLFDFYITRGTAISNPRTAEGREGLPGQKVAGHRTRKAFYFCSTRPMPGHDLFLDDVDYEASISSYSEIPAAR
ncbi:hypothetical protein KM043_016850 [Ampulex compressa]|nr:hypothetical protein KM043_016850 [Ampulex compressa]